MEFRPGDLIQLKKDIEQIARHEAKKAIEGKGEKIVDADETANVGAMSAPAVGDNATNRRQSNLLKRVLYSSGIVVGLTAFIFAGWLAFRSFRHAYEPVSGNNTNPFLTLDSRGHFSQRIVAEEATLNSGALGLTVRQNVRLKGTLNAQRIRSYTWGDTVEVRFSLSQDNAGSETDDIRMAFAIAPDRIYQIDDTNLSLMDALQQNAPETELQQDDLRCTIGSDLSFTRVLWQTKLTHSGDTCTYSHVSNNGHTDQMIWSKGKGLILYHVGYGAAKNSITIKAE